MKRIFVVTVIALVASIAAGAAYKIQLKDGKIIKADAKPVIHNDFAYFNKLGLYLYIPVSQIDMAKTEKLNKHEAKPDLLEVEKTEDLRPAVKAKPVKPVFIDDQELQIIKKRSHLANEGELTGPQGKSGPPRPAVRPGGGEMGGAPSGSQANELRARMSSMLNNRSIEQNRVTNLRARLSKLQDQYNFSVMESDKARIQQEIDSTQADLNSAESNLSGLDSQIQSLQQQIASAPVVVHTGPPPGQATSKNK